MPPADLFQTWVTEYRAIIEKVVRAYGRDARGRDELRQELLYQLWCSAPRFTGQATATTWIYRVCLNTALTWRRATGRRERRFDPEADTAAMAGGEPGPDARAERSDLLEGVYAALRELPSLDRSLLLMALDGIAYREIAAVTGMTENHVGVALSRARGRLAAQLKGIRHELE